MYLFATQNAADFVNLLVRVDAFSLRANIERRLEHESRRDILPPSKRAGLHAGGAQVGVRKPRERYGDAHKRMLCTRLML